MTNHLLCSPHWDYAKLCGTRWAKSQLRFGMMPWWIYDLTLVVHLAWLVDCFAQVCTWLNVFEALMIPTDVYISQGLKQLTRDIAYFSRGEPPRRANTGPKHVGKIPTAWPEHCRVCWLINDVYPSKNIDYTLWFNIGWLWTMPDL